MLVSFLDYNNITKDFPSSVSFKKKGQFPLEKI